MAKAVKVSAGSTASRDEFLKSRPVKTGKKTPVEVTWKEDDDKSHKDTLVVFQVEDPEMGTYLAGRYQKANGEKKMLTPRSLSAMYMVGKTIVDGKVIDAVLMDKDLAKKRDNVEIAANYCYFLEHPERTSKEVQFRFIGELVTVTDEDGNAKYDVTDFYGEYSLAELLATAEVERRFGRKFGGRRFFGHDFGGVLKKMRKTNKAKVEREILKDALKDRKTDAKIDKKSVVDSVDDGEFVDSVVSEIFEEAEKVDPSWEPTESEAEESQAEEETTKAEKPSKDAEDQLAALIKETASRDAGKKLSIANSAKYLLDHPDLQKTVTELVKSNFDPEMVTSILTKLAEKAKVTEQPKEAETKEEKAPEAERVDGEVVKETPRDKQAKQEQKKNSGKKNGKKN